MQKETILKASKLFLKTYGYNPKPTGIEGSLLFSRPTGMGTSDEFLIHFHEKGEEAYLDTRLKQLNEKYTRIAGGEVGRRFFLSSSPLGRVPEAVKENSFTYQVPVWFFDREFSRERKSTPLMLLEEAAKKHEKERIRQPYSIGKEMHEEDLLEHLLEKFVNPEHACLRLIIAPAGYGKSVLTEALYTRLNDKFTKDKQTQKNSARPMLMLPGHVKQSKDLDSLISNFIGTEYDYGVYNKETFKFLVKNNLAIWLLDGLEELILKIPEEFIYSFLEEYIIAGDAASSQIVITIREPVLATLPELKEYIEDYEDWIKVYRLCSWGKDQKQAYFTKNLTIDRDKTQDFIKDLNANPSLKKLSSVPYYCKLITDLKNSNQMEFFNDDCELVTHAFNKLCEREFTKGLDGELLSVDTQRELFSDKEFIESILSGGKISKETLLELGDLYLNSASNKEDQLACLERHALLIKDDEDYDFIHEILKQYLTGECLSKILQSENPDLKLFDYIEMEEDSLLMRFIAKSCSSLNWESKVKNKILELRYTPNEKSKAFCNIIQIVLYSDAEKKDFFIKDILNNRNLAGLVFKDLNMSGFQFQNSKLDCVRFENCNLKEANLNGCYFKNTLFDNECDLINVTTKGAIYESISDSSKIYYNQKDISEFFYKRTDLPIQIHEPCQAIVNIRKITNKIARKGKRHKMPKKFLTNTKCGGGVPAVKYVEALIKEGLFSEEGDYVRVKTNLFDNLKAFAINPAANTTFAALQKVLDNLCTDKKTGCKHIYNG
ncbi:MAG: pentapeptide repeat-containing protein [Nanoarchaeota archaeon]|nr:pentapeptide repeat-containing protein [Nanoarchaeota archaeon]